MVRRFQNVAVIGGGLMGVGIAQVFASAGRSVNIFEPAADMRRTVLGRLTELLESYGLNASDADNVSVCEDLGTALSNAEYVTEAAPEKLDLKRTLFTDMIRLAPPTAILASNTSVIPIHRIVAGLQTADRIIGTHWWNPAGLIPLVEVVPSNQTSPEAVNATMDLLTNVGKAPARISKDVPGFVANRLQHALWREAIAMVADGICDAATLDHCVKNSFGLRLAVLGPLENADLVGLDLTQDIHKIILPELNHMDGPHPYLQDKVASGRLGFKSGAGFRDWSQQQILEVKLRLATHLLRSRPARSGP